MFHDESEDQIETMRALLKAHVKELTGMNDASGLELASVISMISRAYMAVRNRHTGSSDVSGPRWGLLMRLQGEEKHGNKEGITPTCLSRQAHASKNTVSALLRGLEEQGLIRRALDPVDHRLFRIQLTPAGRDLVEATAPQMVTYMNQLAYGLTEEERSQLIGLLEKLYDSILEQSGISPAEIRSIEVPQVGRN